MDQPDSLGYWVRRRRKALDLTQAALAARVGCVVVTIKKIEQDVRRPSRLLAARIADALQLDERERALFIQSARAERAASRLPAPAERPLPASAPQRTPAPQNNLPIPPTPLIGRAQEVDHVCALLRRPVLRLLTLSGPGGTGKTRLALAVAAALSADFADGTIFVDLAPIRDVTLVVVTIAQVFGIDDTPEGSLERVLQQYMRPRQILLLLDNFEYSALRRCSPGCLGRRQPANCWSPAAPPCTSPESRNFQWRRWRCRRRPGKHP